MFTGSLVIVRAAMVVDRYGSSVPDWGDTTRTPVDRVAIQPTTTSETTTEPRTQVVSGWRVYTRAGVDLDLRPTDRVELANGTVCEVVGEVSRWPHPVRPNAVHHVEVDLHRVSG